MNNERELRFAVLIDADNVPYSNIKEMMEEVAKYGNPTFKRIYGDWTKPNLSGWKNILLDNAITPVQQYSYTTGKNATDSAMIIDAMDILYSGRVDGFCLVSSDSDFTRLAIRLREAGMKVYGLGEKKTPSAFISACDKFIYIEILDRNMQELEESISANRGSRRNRYKEDTVSQVDKDLLILISASINDLADEDGWVFLGELGNLILKKKPDFDPRNYGCKKLVPLLKSIGNFEIDERDTGQNNIKLVYVRMKDS